MATVLGIIPAVQTAQLLSENQVRGATGNSQKLKAIANGITGSTFNINFFDDAPKAHFNPSLEGAFNQWSLTNVALIVAGTVAKHFKIKHGARIRSVGTASLVPSIIGGVLGKNNTVERSSFESFHNVSSGQTQTQTTNGGLA